MTTVNLKNTLLCSLAGHILALSLFTLSLGKDPMKLDYGTLIFWGDILPAADLAFRASGRKADAIGLSENASGVSFLRISNHESRSADIKYNLKPFARFASLEQDKPVMLQEAPAVFAMPARKDSPLIFHPLLPYQLQLYFRDRQTVHIELMFNIISGKRNKAIAVKRKISSGNLEADLLCLRYISHYLFIQQARFAPNNWQPAKIDLSK
ncbi:MAG: hypothetical protein PHH68_01190 [Candidatus Omnitrophica bacterium]|jgi:hypothetical protein|nr:hypothetical protein [Candidatus Omnitrophota bacterium]MDD5078925.1 hypothetical protein [Candidatus Omnitrophota bacterium]